MTTHASRELVAAMRGEPPSRSKPGLMASSECGADSVAAVLAYKSEVEPASLFRTREWSGLVDCPACLALMRDARGPDWDVIESNLSRLDAARRAG